MENPLNLSLSTVIESVATFHNAFGIRNAPSPEAAPSPETIALRHRLMAEENEEYLEAAKAGDVVEVADALDNEFWGRLRLNREVQLIVVAMNDHKANLEAVRRVRHFLAEARIAATSSGERLPRPTSSRVPAIARTML